MSLAEARVVRMRLRANASRPGNGKITSTGSLNGKAFAPPAGYVPGPYAFGLDHHSENGRRIVGHDGSIAGFDALIQTYVDEGLTIIVLTNTNGAAHPLGAKIAKILMPDPRGNYLKRPQSVETGH